MKVKQLQLQTLDTILDKRGIHDADFIKLDVQGSEMDVLKGAEKTLQRGVEFILIETQLIEYNKGAPMFLTLVNYMDSIGYEVFDIWEMHYQPWAKCLCSSSGQLSEIDILFIRKNSPYKIKRDVSM